MSKQVYAAAIHRVRQDSWTRKDVTTLRWVKAVSKDEARGKAERLEREELGDEAKYWSFGAVLAAPVPEIEETENDDSNEDQDEA